MIHIIIPGVPIAQGRPRITTQGGYARAYDPLKSKVYKRLVAHYAVIAMRGKPLFTGAVEVNLLFVFEPPKSWSKKKKEAALSGGGAWHIQKPDKDNLSKSILDGLTGICYADDCQVATGHQDKKWGHPARVVVELREV